MVNTPQNFFGLGTSYALEKSGSASWTDGSGNLWVFGGCELRLCGILGNDLWTYSPANATWTYVGGSNDYVGTGFGVYGTKGTASAASIPGARSGAASWTDHSYNFWLFGGNGYDAAGDNGTLNDLWMYDPTADVWTWVSGSNGVNAQGVYGVQGTPAPANVPGARDPGATWVDMSGNFWLLGGGGIDSTGNNGSLNDLWMYSPSTGQWTWIGGSSTANAQGVYGVQGTAAATNIPGARSGEASWIDASGNLWIFGGAGFDSTSTFGELNDLWMYSPSAGQWTWVGGSNTVNSADACDLQGSSAGSNVPGARSGSAFWIDGSGNFWLLGGTCPGPLQGPPPANLPDLWTYSPSTGMWTWMGEPLLPWAGNTIGANTWTNSTGHVWVFGGYYYGDVVPYPSGELFEYSP